LLRPAFTHALADTLLAGKHVNLISPHGRGRRQTLLDLEGLLNDVLVRKIDLKREQNKWDLWLEETLGLSGQTVVIIHNIEYANPEQKQRLECLSSDNRFCFLCTLEHKSHALALSANNTVLPVETATI